MHILRSVLSLLFSAVMLQAQGFPEPVNPKASPEARALLRFFQSISGKRTISGQHNFPNTIAQWTNRVGDLTGNYPGLYGQDFGFQDGEDKDSILARPALVEEIKRQHRNGAVVTLTWHSVRPTQDEPVTFRESVQGKLTDYEWKELLTPGTTLNKRWCAQVDVIAGYLKQLRDARVPILWRPYHEMNGSWFWWGGRKGKGGSEALYRMMFDRYVKVHQLDNLIWVWNANVPNGRTEPYADYFPGLEYADMVTVDNYDTYKTSYYEDAVKLAAGKPIALGEVGPIPSPEALKAQPKWTYFMVWSGFVEEGEMLDALKATFQYPAMMHRDDAAMKKAMEAVRKAAAEATFTPVTPGALPQTRTLLARLYQAPAQGVLSGQANESASPAGATTLIAQATSKSPSLFGQELGTESPVSRQAILEEVKKQAAKGAIISLSWKGPRPTDEEASEARLNGPLSEYEWNDLLTPGSPLQQRWAAQVDALAGTLRQLQDAGIVVMWRPYPRANANGYWWSGRKGVRGSAELYRMLFDRLVNQHKLGNLIWVWEAAAPSFGRPGGAPTATGAVTAGAPITAAPPPGASGSYDDFFPGLLYVDAISVDIENANALRRRGVPRLALGKVVGLSLGGRVPEMATLAQPKAWSWFLAAPACTATPESLEALVKLYQDPQCLTGTGSQRAK